MGGEIPGPSLDVKSINQIRDRIKPGANLLKVLPYNVAKLFDNVSTRQLIAGLDRDTKELVVTYVMDNIAADLAGLDESPYKQAIVGETPTVSLDWVFGTLKYIDAAAKKIQFWGADRLES